jgi:hypothetical protein
MNLAVLPAAAAAAAIAAAPLPTAPPAPELAPPAASSIKLSKLKLRRGPVEGWAGPATAPAVAPEELDPEKTFDVVDDKDPRPGAMADLFPPVAPSRSLMTGLFSKGSSASKTS